LPPDLEPRATESMGQIINLIQLLFEQGLAYTSPSGDVFYSVSKFPDYGQLSGKQVNDLQAGERVAINESKRDPLDFVLWKRAKADEPYWNSPWGRGRPGWHIECSAMSTCCLGNHFDIHGGGMDLQFPHHENEIAQSVGATGEQFVNYWMHNGFVRVDNEKMSKSFGNFFTLKDVRENYQSEVIRFFIVSSHYRSPLNYSNESLEDAKSALVRFYTALRSVDVTSTDLLVESKTAFELAMNDDFNTPEAIAVLFSLANTLNKLKQENASDIGVYANTLKTLAGYLGILQQDPDSFLQGRDGYLKENEQIEKKINQRTVAKTNKDWLLADQIRDELKAEGILLEDSAKGTTWRRQ